MTSARHSLPRRPASGISLVELMVGLVVGLLVSLAAAKSAELFTAVQRQGVAAGGGATNATSALAAIKEDIATSGMGFFASGIFRCSNLNLSAGNSVIANNTAFAPVQAARVGSNDRLDVVYAQDVSAGAWTELKEVSNGGSATLKSLLPVTAAQRPAILLARKRKDLASPCVVRTVTASVDPDITTGTKQTLTFDNTGLHNQGTFAVNTSFLEDSPVVMLGNVNWNRYEVEGTDLVIRRQIDNTRAVLLSNVVAFRIQYGATNGASAIEQWNETTDAGWAAVTSANIARTRAVRVGVIVRSAQREREDTLDGNKCKATANKPVLFRGTPDEVTITPPGSDWDCYRYRTAEVVAPLRNLVQGTVAINWPATVVTP